MPGQLLSMQRKSKVIILVKKSIKLLTSILIKLNFYFQKPFRYDVLDKWLRIKGVFILDIGCGNHSSSKTKRYYPFCYYFGLDANKKYNNNEKDFAVMEDFYEIDLNRNIEKTKEIPDNFFDVLILSHVIEHLNNGELVLKSLFPKLKKGGVIYIETPSPQTMHFCDGLNFYKDPTHIKVYPLEDLRRILLSERFSVIKEGRRRSLKRIIFLPFYLLGALFYYKYIPSSIFYDITGFANYLVAIKD